MKIIKNKKGFTLIELVIIITLITILGYFATPYIANLTEDTQENVNLLN
ncbi:MAG: prepilin-type N-terminal cleavage/methylation domain-containing protein, partial [bacterium]